MSIEERITEVLSRHRFERHSVSEAGYFAWWGHCVACGFESDRRNSSYVGWELDMRDDEARHCASVLAFELRLNEVFASAEYIEANAATLNPKYAAAYDVLAKRRKGGAL